MIRAFLLSILIALLSAQASWGQIPQTMSYQGILTDDAGTPLNGEYHLRFSIYNVATGGTELWSETHNSVPVTDGVFSVVLGSVDNPLTPDKVDFAEQYWLGIVIDAFPELIPRIPLTSAAYSLKAQSVADGTVTEAKIADDAVTSGKIANGQVVRSLNGLTDAIILAGGPNTTILESGDTITINSNSWGLTGNAGTTPGTHFLGTTDIVPLELRVNGARALRLEYADIPNIIGGYSGNSVAAGIYGATIGGGGRESGPNAVTAEATFGTIGGGFANTVSGYGNTVGGGGYNQASEEFATVGGGDRNIASAEWATVPGGGSNLADGLYSFAAGRQAKAIHDGTFVWGDSIDADIASTGINQFVVRATGGVRIHAGELVLEPSSPGLRFPDGTLQTSIGWSLTGNAGTTPGAHFLGTTDDIPLDLRVNGERALRLEYAEDYGYPSPNIIGGYSGNSVTEGVFGATISGGGRQGVIGPDVTWGPNTVTANYGTIGGGQYNTASGRGATVGGGRYNTASGDYATVGGGYHNVARGEFAAVASGGTENAALGMSSTVGGGVYNAAVDTCSTVGGGAANHANGNYTTVGGGRDNNTTSYAATIGGGYRNTASGDYAIVPGGHSNTAQGMCSFAAGRNAKAEADGCFVWADSSEGEISTGTPDRWIARCSGGVYFYTNSTATTGARLIANESTWDDLSDRAAKRNIRPVDVKDILAKLSEVPISRWSYKAQKSNIEHIGPMAQDFYAAFSLGADDRHISTVDPDGVALAAIQGLYELVKEKDKQITTLEERVTALEALISSQGGVRK